MDEYDLDEYLEDMEEFMQDFTDDGEVFMSQGGVLVEFDIFIQWYRLLEDFSPELMAGDVMPRDWGLL